MPIDLDLTDVQRAVASSVDRFCQDLCTDRVARAAADEFPSHLWRALGDLGVLAMATPLGSGGAQEIAVAASILGKALFPGPLAASFFATQVLADVDRDRVARGEALVSVGVPPIMPWATVATYYLQVEERRVYSVRPKSSAVPVPTLGGVPWGRVDLQRVASLGDVTRALALHDVALAAYLVGAAQRLLDLACDHARARRQFGRSIGDFQAVSHPLADCAMRLAGARALALRAAFCVDRDDASAPRRASAARISAATAAARTLLVGHQTFGALGATVEGPVYPIAIRIRQLVSDPVGRAAGYDSILTQFGL